MLNAVTSALTTVVDWVGTVVSAVVTGGETPGASVEKRSAVVFWPFCAKRLVDLLPSLRSCCSNFCNPLE